MCCNIFSGFKKRAPRAIGEIRRFAEKAMGTPDVRIEARLNKHIWSQGIRYLSNLSISLGSKPVGVNFVAIDFSHLILFIVVLSAPLHQPLFVSGLGTGSLMAGNVTNRLPHTPI